MPLSEYEQRVLEQMEQQLRSDDPKLAKAIAGGAPRRPLHVALGGVAVLAGIGLLFAGLSSGMIWVGLLGFVVMFGGVLLAMRRPHVGAGAADAAPAAQPAAQRSASFMDRLEQRWDRRRDQDR